MSIPVQVETRVEPLRGANDDYLYLSYLHEYNRCPSQVTLKFSKLCRGFHRFCSHVLGAYICNIDLCASAEDDNVEDNNQEIKPGRGIIDRWLPRPLARSTWRRNLRCGWIPKAILIFLLLAMVVLWVDIIHLYKYQINEMRLKRVQELIREFGPTKLTAIHRRHSGLDVMAGLDRLEAINKSISPVDDKSEMIVSLGRFGSILEARSIELHWALAYLGDKFIAWSFINNCAYLMAISVGCGLYLFFTWIYLFFRRHDCQFLRDQIDYGAEELRVDAACRTQVLKYLESSRIYATIVAKQRKSTALIGRSNRPASRLKKFNPRTSLPAGDLRRLNQTTAEVEGRGAPDHASDSLVSRLLMQMLASGALRPFNRCYHWLRLRDITHTFIYLNAIGYAAVFDLGAMYVLYQSATTRFDPGELCFLGLVLIAAAGFIFHFTTITLASLDQSLLVRHVLRSIRNCVRLNERLLVHANLKAPRLLPPEGGGKQVRQVASIERANANYLFALMTYKMFVTQFKPFKRTHRDLCMVVFSSALILPALARIHMPYMEQDATMKFRLIVFIMCTSSLVPLNAMFLPMCYLHARCHELSIELSSLIAHIARVRQDEEINGGAKVYNEHAVTVLLKELSDPKKMLAQFVVESVCFKATYADLLRLHFWWGLVVLSVLQSSNSEYGTELFGSYLRDPLSVWCFRLV